MRSAGSPDGGRRCFAGTLFNRFECVGARYFFAVQQISFAGGEAAGGIPVAKGFLVSIATPGFALECVRPSASTGHLALPGWICSRHGFTPAGECGLAPGKKNTRQAAWPASGCLNQTGLAANLRANGCRGERKTRSSALSEGMPADAGSRPYRCPRVVKPGQRSRRGCRRPSCRGSPATYVRSDMRAVATAPSHSTC